MDAPFENIDIPQGNDPPRAHAYCKKCREDRWLNVSEHEGALELTCPVCGARHKHAMGKRA